MPPFVCLRAGAGQGLCAPLWPILWGLGLPPKLPGELCKLHPGFRASSVGRATHPGDPVLCPSASRPCQSLDAASCCDLLCSVSYVTMGFPTMHSLVQCQGKGTNNVPLWQPNVLPARLGSRAHFPSPPEWIPPAKAAFSFPLFSLFPPPPYSDFSSSAKGFLQVKAFIEQEHLKLQIIFMSSLIHLLVLIVFTQQIMIKMFYISIQRSVMKPCENLQRKTLTR